MAVFGTAPVFMSIGTGEPHQIGTIEIQVGPEGSVTAYDSLAGLADALAVELRRKSRMTP